MAGYIVGMEIYAVDASDETIQFDTMQDALDLLHADHTDEELLDWHIETFEDELTRTLYVEWLPRLAGDGTVIWEQQPTRVWEKFDGFPPQP